MSAMLTPPAPPLAAPQLYRFTVGQCEAMLAAGIFSDKARVELIDGLLVVKEMDNSPHATSCLLVAAALGAVLPAGWHLRSERLLHLADDLPVPDNHIVRGSIRDYAGRHPVAADAGLVVEVADSSLANDRTRKMALYAASAIPVYWIVNLIDRVLEVRSGPRGTGAAADYADLRVFGPADAAPLVLDGTAAGTVAVADLLP